MEHFRIPFQGRQLVLRDLEERDVPALVSYWFDGPPGFLRAIGVDPQKDPSREEMAQRLRASLAPPGALERAYFVADLGERPVAYTNLNFRSSRLAYAHVHVLDAALRHQGLASALFARTFAVFFERLPLDEIVMETSPENVAVNRQLQGLGLEPRPAVIDSPDGMARPGRFNVYAVVRAAVAALGAAPAKP